MPTLAKPPIYPECRYIRSNFADFGASILAVLSIDVSGVHCIAWRGPGASASPGEESELVPPAVGVVAGVLVDGGLQVEHQHVVIQHLERIS